ncbi:hypothetical protein OROMI_013499 [Orobanche minor]
MASHPCPSICPVIFLNIFQLKYFMDARFVEGMNEFFRCWLNGTVCRWSKRHGWTRIVFVSNSQISEDKAVLMRGGGLIYKCRRRRKKEDFDISDAQYKHALAVENLSPRLAALRIELCPVHMSESYFWMVYFVLLHSRLNKHDADLLTSPQVVNIKSIYGLVQARVVWMQELQKQTREESSWLGLTTFLSKETVDYRQNLIMHSNEDGHLGNVCGPISPVESSMHGMTADHEFEKHTVNEMEFIDKSVIKEDLAPELEKEIIVSSSIEIIEDDTDEDDWLKEDSDLIGYSGTSVVVNEEDISFSDLEDDLDYTMPIKYKMALTEGDTMTKSSC